MKHILIFYYFVAAISSFVFADFACAEEAIFTKKMAEEHLASNGIRWRQTYAPIEEADAKLAQAKAPTNLLMNAFSREFVARTSEIMYGLSSNLDNVIGGGVTGIEGKYEFYNPVNEPRIKAAEENQRLGRATSLQYQNDLRFLVLLRYLTAQQFHKKSQVADMMLNKDSQLFQFATEKVRVGAGVPLDLARGEALVEKDKFKKLEAESSYLKAIQDLKELVNDLPSSVALESLEFHELPAHIIARLQKKSEDRPELKVAEYSFKAMKYFKEATDNEQKMTISLYGEVGSAGIQLFGLVNSLSGAVGVQVNWPLFTGGYQQAKSAELLSKLNTLDLQQHQVEIETKSQLTTATAQLEFTRKVVLSSQKQVELARKELSYAEKKIKIGSSSNLELITAQTNLGTALEMNVQAIFSYEAAKIQFFHLIADADSYLEFENSKGVSHE